MKGTAEKILEPPIEDAKPDDSWPETVGVEGSTALEFMWVCRAKTDDYSEAVSIGGCQHLKR